MSPLSGQGDRIEPENAAQTSRICSADGCVTGAYGELHHDNTTVPCDFEKAVSMKLRKALNNSTRSKLLSLSIFSVYECVCVCVCFVTGML